MKYRSVLACFLTCVFVLSAASLLCARGVEPLVITRVSPDTLETMPNKALTIVLRLVNSSDEDMELHEKVDIPEGWRLLIPTEDFTLSAGNSELRFITLSVPYSARRGSYEITYSVMGDMDSIEIHKCVVQIEVLPRYLLEITPERIPSYAFVGEKYEASFRVTNRSNTDLLVGLSLDSHPDFRTTISERNLSLSPGETKQVLVEVSVDSDIFEKTTHRFTIQAKGLGISGEQVNASTRASVEILPRVSGIDDAFHRLPLTVGVTMGFRGDLGVQFELSGRGSLDESGERWVALLIRPPGLAITGESFPKKPEQYSFSYWDSTKSLHLGDQRFTLSNLTELRVEGRGLEGSFTLSQFDFGAYYRQEQRTGKDGWALSVGFNPGESFSISAGYLDREGAASRERVLTLSSGLTLGESHDLRLEYAAGLVEHSGWAVQAEAVGTVGDFKYNVDLLHAGPDFPGRVSDRQSARLRLDYRVFPQLSLYGIFGVTNTNIELDPSLVARITAGGELGGAFWWSNSRIGASYHVLLVEDKSAEPDFIYLSHAFKLDFRQRFEKGWLSTYYELRLKEDLLEPDTVLSDRLGLSVYYRPHLNQQHSASLGLQRPDISEEEIISHLSFNSRFSMGEARITIDFTRSGLFDTSGTNRLTGDLTLPLKDFGALHFNGSSFFSKEGIRFSFSFGVIMDVLRVPVSRREVGKATGIIYDLEDPLWNGISNVIVRINDLTAVTDRHGRFVFAGLSPGHYYLQIDQGSLPRGHVPALVMPVAFVVKAREEIEFEIGVTRAASLEGTSTVYSPVNKNNINNNLDSHNASNPENNRITINKDVELFPERGIEGILLVLRSADGETKTQRTSTDGSFRFTDLRPGIWELEVYDAGRLPSNHHIEQTSFIIELEPGKSEEIEIRIIPRVREIHFIDDGEVH